MGMLLLPQYLADELYPALLGLFTPVVHRKRAAPKSSNQEAPKEHQL
jgi:hypothetical protein